MKLRESDKSRINLVFSHILWKQGKCVFLPHKKELLRVLAQQATFSLHKSILTNVRWSIFPQIFRSSTRPPYWTHRRVVSKSLKKSTTWWTSGKRVFLSKVVNWEILPTQWKRWVSDILSLRGEENKGICWSNLLSPFKDAWKWTHFSQTQWRMINQQSQIFRWQKSACLRTGLQPLISKDKYVTGDKHLSFHLPGIYVWIWWTAQMTTFVE